MVEISVIICTHNRQSYLLKALGSLERQSLAREIFEIIVVDNASNDNTAAIVKEWLKTFANIKYVYESRLGLSIARNTGVEIAQGRYVVYLDDDAVAVPGWLESILDTFHGFPDIGAVGGPVQLDWGGSPPEWLPRRDWSLYSFLDYGPIGRFISNGEHLVGANMGFVRQQLLHIGGFDPHLGRKGVSLLSGEESSVFNLLRANSLKIYYQPKALVYHTVPQERQTKRWLSRRTFWDGASQPLLDYGLGMPGLYYLRRVVSDLKQLFRFTLNVMLAISLAKEKKLAAKLIWLQRAGRLRTNLYLLLKWI